MHPMASTSNGHGTANGISDAGGANGQTSWAMRRNSHTSPGSKAKMSPDLMTYDSISSTDQVNAVADRNPTVMKSSEDTNHSSSTEANGPSSQADRTPNSDEKDSRDVNIDFSHVPDVQPPVSNNKGEGQNYFLQTLSAPYKRLEHPADKSLMLSLIGSIMFLIVALVVFCPVLIIVVILVPLGCIGKSCLNCCCCCKSNQTCTCCCSKMLSHSDAIWLHDTHLNRSIVQSLITLEVGLDPVKIRDLIHARLVSAQGKGEKRLYPRFTQKIVRLYSGYKWVDDMDFAIENHVYEVPNTVQTRTDLENYISEMASREFPPDRPLWDIQVLSKFGESKDTLVLFRVHPCITDGISLIQILLNSVVDEHSMCSLKPRFGRGAMVINVLRALVVGPLIFLQKWLFTRRDYNLLHGSPMSGKKIIAWSEPFSFAKATRIKQVTRSTFNDILLSAAAGSIRTYLQTKGVLNPYDMLCMIPVDLRTNDSKVVMGTKFSVVDLTLPTNTEGAIPRLWEVKHQMDQVKNSADPIVLYGGHWLLSRMLPACLGRRIWRSLCNKTTCLISNLPGPDTTLVFGSRQIKNVMYWMPPPEDVALSISFLTYADQLSMTVIADQAVVTDPHILTKDFILQVRPNLFIRSHCSQNPLTSRDASLSVEPRKSTFFAPKYQLLRFI